MMEQLKKQGLLDNTVEIFNSDNGGVGGYVLKLLFYVAGRIPHL